MGQRLSDDLIDKMRFENLAREDVDELAEPTGINLAKLAIRYADGVIAGVPEIDPQLTAYARERNLPILPYVPIDKDDQAFVRAYNHFYDDLLTSR